MRRIVASSAHLDYDARGRGSLGGVFRHQLAMTGQERPRVCLVMTASGEPATWNSIVLQALADAGAVGSVLTLFPWPNVDDITAHLLAQDAIWVGGGSVVNLLALWRAHGVDEAMRAAWDAGVVLGGVSAGSLCWHQGGTTDSYGPTLRPLLNGLGMLGFSNCPHYDGDAQRRPLYRSLVAAGELAAGYATDDGVGLVFEDQELVDVVAERPGAYAWRVEADGHGGAVEARIEPRLLA